MEDIEKWYMRLLLTLAASFFWLYFPFNLPSYIFFRAAGTLYVVFELFFSIVGFFESYNMDKDIIWNVIGVFFLSIVVSPFIWPRLFVWPVLIMNLFILVGGVELICRNYERSLQFWDRSYDPDNKYVWVMEQGVFIFISTLFVVLLLPSAVHILRKTAWYNRVITIWK